MEKEYSLTWEGHVQHVRESFLRLLENSDICDVTLYTEGQKIGAHKVFLKACSGYFSQLFEDLKNEHAIIVLKGQISIEIDKLEAFLDAADFLKVYGLTERALSKRGHSITTETDTCNNSDFERSCTPKTISPNFFSRSVEKCGEYSELSETSAECSLSLETTKSRVCNFKNKNVPVTLPSLSEKSQYDLYNVINPLQQIQAVYKTHGVHLHKDLLNNNKDNEMSATSSFHKPVYRKYSLDSPTRIGDWTSDYENRSVNCVTDVQESVQENTIDSPHDKDTLHSTKKMKVKHERLSTELEEIGEAESFDFDHTTTDAVIEVSDEDDDDDDDDDSLK